MMKFLGKKPGRVQKQFIYESILHVFVFFIHNRKKEADMHSKNGTIKIRDKVKKIINDFQIAKGYKNKYTQF